MSVVLDEDATEDLVRHKPAFIRRVQIRGYKSIAFCDVTLEPLTILVGRNASGKSNFLDALAFVGELMELRATEAVSNRNGWRQIHCRHSPSSKIEFGLEATFDSNNLAWDAEYWFSLEIADRNQIRVYQEDLTLTEKVSGLRVGYKVADGDLEWLGQENFEDDSLWTREIDPQLVADNGRLEDPRTFGRRRYDRLLLSVIGTQPFVDFSESLRSSCVYNFSPHEIRLPQPFRALPILSRDGSNLARAIEGLREIEPDTVDRINQYLNAIVPDVTSFDVRELGDFETVRFHLNAKQGESPQEFDASSMSDGTLRILSALVAAYQIVLPRGFPGFIAIEEPETALHPAAMRALVDALHEATLRTQILLTTHGAEMLDNPTIRPENIRVVQMIDGQTVIGPVDEGSVDIVRQKLDTLGGLERQNQLDPDLDDQDRQRRIQSNGKGLH